MHYVVERLLGAASLFGHSLMLRSAASAIAVSAKAWSSNPNDKHVLMQARDWPFKPKLQDGLGIRATYQGKRVGKYCYRPGTSWALTDLAFRKSLAPSEKQREGIYRQFGGRSQRLLHNSKAFNFSSKSPRRLFK